MKTACVVVLGDLARSPRMRAHADALSAAGFRVSLIGYLDAPVDVPAGVELVPLAQRPARASLIYMALRQLWAAAVLWRALTRRPADVVLVQTPPALPTLAVARIASWFLGARLVVDWHNFGDAMLGLKLGHDSKVVRLARWLERTLARRADAHLCVTRAMERRLSEECGVRAVALPDLPRTTVAWTRAAARARLAELVPIEPDAVVAVTSTSWTLDEDHAMLVDALDRCAARGSPGARVTAVMTGRGPARAAFEDMLTRRPSGAPPVHLLWVADVDYWAILRGADVGVSLHRSASGVDFPMKIVDMRAAGVPVLALDYGPALREGFESGRDGFHFVDAESLADLLDRAATGLGIAVKPAPESWLQSWNGVAGKFFEDI